MGKVNLVLGLLLRDGALGVLRQLCLGEFRFKELNDIVTNTRTLTKRLRELVAEGLIQKNGAHYRITDYGFDTVLTMAEFEGKARRQEVGYEEFAKIRFGWVRISLMRLKELFHEEFGEKLISFVIYGSLVKESFELGRSDIDLLYITADGTKKVWQREKSVLTIFRSTWEYRACEHWLKTHRIYGYPEVTTASLPKSHATTFQPMYLDMLTHRAILYDRERFFQHLMKKLAEALKDLGTIRVEYPDGTCLWFLKPDIAPGEIIQIGLA